MTVLIIALSATPIPWAEILPERRIFTNRVDSVSRHRDDATSALRHNPMYLSMLNHRFA